MRLTLHSFDKHYTGGYIYIGVIGVPYSHEGAGVPGGGGSVQQTALIKQTVSFSLRVIVKAKAKEKRGPARILKSTLCSDIFLFFPLSPRQCKGTSGARAPRKYSL
jgi:hypothetical protein